MEVLNAYASQSSLQALLAYSQEYRRAMLHVAHGLSADESFPWQYLLQ